MRKFVKILFLVCLILPINLFSQNIDSLKDTVNEQIIIVDSIDLSGKDTTAINDTTPSNDTIQVAENENKIDEPIDFKSKDSMYISVKDKIIVLFGEGYLENTGMKLKADSVGIDLDKKELKAQGLTDSTGKITGKPVFTSEEKDYTADRMRYNFDTKKGIVYNVITKESEGYLHGQVVKIHNNDQMHILEGKYTTCDLPHPHYYIDLTKAKLIKNDKVISGPIYLVIQDIPIKIIGAPFGFFPLSRKNTSGIHLPTYADELDIGLGLKDFGYFWAVNDYFDVDITAEAYSKGSWGINIMSNIKKRYWFTSKLNFNFFHYQNGEKIIPSTQIHNTYKVVFSFNQDPKALPNSHFSANINYVTGNIEQYKATNINDFVKTNTSSSMAYQTSLGNLFNFSMTGNLNQNLSDSTDAIRFPTMSFSMNKWYIFKPRNKPARGKWYEKLAVSFTSNASNQVTVHDTLLRKHFDQVLKQMQSGFRYNVPFQTSLTVLKYFQITPKFDWTGRLYPYKFEKRNVIQQDTSYIVTDTVRGLYHVYNYNFHVGFNTRIYGLFNLNIGRLKAIRHVLSPSISYTYSPDFSEEKYGYYGVDPTDTSRRYSYYQGTVYGSPSAGEQQSLTFSLNNNFEAKIVQGKGKDQTFKKIKLLDNLSLNTSYNFAKDSLKMNMINLRASVSPFKNTNVNFNSVFDPYVIDDNGVRIDRYELVENHRLARLTSSSLSFNTAFASKDIRQMFGKEENTDDFKWSTTLQYTFSFSKNFNVEKQEFDINLSQNLSSNFTIIPTPMWRFSVRTGYDFNVNQITSTTFNIYRDLHCWEMSLQVTPFGRMKSYFFQINIKSSMFSAIKLKRTRSWHDNLVD